MIQNPQSEARHTIRVSRSIEATYSHDCPPIRCRVEDVSETGMYLDSRHALPLGQLIRFSLDLPDENPDRPIEGIGRVVWTEQMLGAGIEFVELDPADRERIRYFVAAVLFGVDPA
ncbi:MAG: PilZ domain-containing protein [Acidobacteria bacterium]|nr:MAG: PilZ domain-containing protein [Acidobacteriota bacterium]REK11251.1 MAG: PilZ domain-containing protein [Acidobacteriota bacterium]